MKIEKTHMEPYRDHYYPAPPVNGRLPSNTDRFARLLQEAVEKADRDG